MNQLTFVALSSGTVSLETIGQPETMARTPKESGAIARRYLESLGKRI